MFYFAWLTKLYILIYLLCFYFFFDVLFTILLKKIFWDILCFEIVEIVFYSISPCYLTLFKNGHLFFTGTQAFPNLGNKLINI